VFCPRQRGQPVHGFHFDEVRQFADACSKIKTIKFRLSVFLYRIRIFQAHFSAISMHFAHVRNNSLYSVLFRAAKENL
jgi:hypothetical protein